MGLVRLSSVCVCVYDVKIDQHQNNLIKGKNMIKIKKRTLLRIVADVVVDKDVLQSVSRFFCPKTTFPLVRKGKMCYQNNNSKNNNKVIWLGTIFAAENEIWYDICVLVLREKKKQARTHAHTHTHEHTSATNLFHVICFVSYRRILGKHNTTHTTWSCEFYMCPSAANQRWQTFQERQWTSRWSAQCVNWCDLLYCYKRYKTFKTMSFFACSSSPLE